MAHTVISLGCLDDAGWTWTGGKGKLLIHNGDKDLVAKIPKSDGLYKITTDFVALVNDMIYTAYWGMYHTLTFTR